MNKSQNDKPHINFEDEISLLEIYDAIWDKKLYITALTMASIIISILYAVNLPNIYKSEAIMMPIESNSEINGMLGQYSGMASLAGISLPSKSTSKSQEAIVRIQSFDFFSNHFLPNIMLEDLLAVKEWDSGTNSISYNDDIYNPELGEWNKEIRAQGLKTPSTQLAYHAFKEKITILKDKTSGYVTLSIEHQSPFISKQWTQIVIDKIDEVMRFEDKKDATKSIEYLNNISSTVNYEGVKKTLSSLQEEQMKRLMMIEARENYIFKMLDPPIVPESKSQPNRLVIVILGAILGMFFSILGFLVSHYARKNSKHI
jgi:hypothetical protein